MGNPEKEKPPPGETGGGKGGDEAPDRRVANGAGVNPADGEQRKPFRNIVPDLRNRAFVFATIADIDDLLNRHGPGAGSTALVAWLALLKIAYERDALTFAASLSEIGRRTAMPDRKQLCRVLARLEGANFIRVDRDESPGRNQKQNVYHLLRGPYRQAVNASGKLPLASGKKPRKKPGKKPHFFINAGGNKTTSKLNEEPPTGEPASPFVAAGGPPQGEPTPKVENEDGGEPAGVVGGKYEYKPSFVEYHQ